MSIEAEHWSGVQAGFHDVEDLVRSDALALEAAWSVSHQTNRVVARPNGEAPAELVPTARPPEDCRSLGVTVIQLAFDTGEPQPSGHRGLTEAEYQRATDIERHQRAGDAHVLFGAQVLVVVRGMIVEQMTAPETEASSHMPASTAYQLQVPEHGRWHRGAHRPGLGKTAFVTIAERLQAEAEALAANSGEYPRG